MRTTVTVIILTKNIRSVAQPRSTLRRTPRRTLRRPVTTTSQSSGSTRTPLLVQLPPWLDQQEEENNLDSYVYSSFNPMFTHLRLFLKSLLYITESTS